MLDYGLPSFRVRDLTDHVEDGDVRQTVVQIYLSPEVKGQNNPIPSGPLDVYRSAENNLFVSIGGGYRSCGRGRQHTSMKCLC